MDQHPGEELQRVNGLGAHGGALPLVGAILGLRPGAQFVVVADPDVVIFKVLDPPALSEFTSLVARARQVAKRAGLRPADVVKAVSKVRRAR